MIQYKELAEERYPDTYFDGAIEFDDTIAKFKRLAFISGCESQQGEVKKEAIGFAEWAQNNQFTMYNGEWSSTKVYYAHDKYTTEQLYNLFKSKK